VCVCVHQHCKLVPTDVTCQIHALTHTHTRTPTLTHVHTHTHTHTHTNTYTNTHCGPMHLKHRAPYTLKNPIYIKKIHKKRSLCIQDSVSVARDLVYVTTWNVTIWKRVMYVRVSSFMLLRKLNHEPLGYVCKGLIIHVSHNMTKGYVCKGLIM